MDKPARSRPRRPPARPAPAAPAAPPRVERVLVWFRRDLRVVDHPALARALREADAVWCAFVLDREILDGLPRRDRRVAFIRDSLADLDRQLADLASACGGGKARLIVRHARAAEEIPRLARALDVQAVYCHRDDDPAALARDARVARALESDGRRLETAKDHVIFERSELLTGTGKPYSVFTPYRNAWSKALHAAPAALAPHASDSGAGALAAVPAALAPPWRGRRAVPRLDEFGFDPPDPRHADPGLRPGSAGAEEVLTEFLDRLDDYDDARDFPAKAGCSHLGVHLRFGTLSVRRLAGLAVQRVEGGSRGAQTWLSELIWRDFFQQVLHHHPHVVGHAFRSEFEGLRWARGADADARFAAWCAGRTGYPLVDAGMRQLAATGYMHNRLRMVTASFLSKDLGLDWRRGEAWFALLLNDFELASNNGNWQWAASTGCDAQPWFRIFNPVTQSQRFDPAGAFIRRFVPELAKLRAPDIHAPWQAKPETLAEAGITLGRDYPPPIVDHDEARAQTLERYGSLRGGRPKGKPS
jgi:deoxyribodipyrimidine photo-lyase